jgi:hypothetical protein
LGPEVPLLPMQHPVSPRGFGPGHHAPRSRRRRARLRTRALAWELTRWQITCFDFWEMGGSPCEKRWERALRGRKPTGAQLLAGESLFAENLRFVRLADVKMESAGRGHATLRDQLKAFERRMLVATRPAQDTVEEAAKTAIPVKTERVALCDPAGTVRPGDILPPDLARAFEDVPSRVRDDVDVSSYPRSCYLVSEAEEKKLRRRLLDTKMARLVEESMIPLGPDGKLLLAGLFCVTHKEDFDRLIVDRRPANHTEKRLGWSRLPMGPSWFESCCREALSSEGAATT